MQSLDEFLDMNYFNRQKNIGKGKFNKVFEVIDNETNVVYAAKTPLKEISKFNKEEMIKYCQDVNIISRLNHPSIISFIGFSPIDFKERQKPVLITEFASNNTLSSIIESGNDVHKEWNYTKKLINIYGIASAMSYLHTHNIVHCDLTPKNVLVDKNFYPKLYRFNYSKETEEISFKHVVQVNKNSKYLAPEIKERSEYSKSSDVYAYSLLVYDILNDKIESSEDLPEIKESIPQCYRELIERCLSHNPEDRPTFDDIIILLETNPSFITEDVNKDEYENYIKMIKAYPTTFDSTQPILHLEDLIQKIENMERLETIEKLLAQKNPKELMKYLNDYCDEQTTSSIFDRCFADYPEIYQELCREGISMNNNVANQKHALSIIFEKDTDKALFKQMRSYLEDSVKKGFVSSYFSLARLSYIFFNKENLAFNLAKAGAKMGEKYSKCLLGYFFAHGIGTKKDHKKGVEMMLESGADEYCDLFATDIAVYYIEELHQNDKSMLCNIHNENENETKKISTKKVENENKKEEKIENKNDNDDEKVENKNDNEQIENKNDDEKIESKDDDEKAENKNDNDDEKAENKNDNDDEKAENKNDNDDEKAENKNDNDDEKAENKNDDEQIENKNDDEKVENKDDDEQIENKNDDEKVENKDETINQEIKENEEINEYDYNTNNNNDDDDYEYDALIEYDEIIEYEYEEDLNDTSAFHWFEKAYKLSKTKVTINNYALCFLHGIGVPKDVEKAKEIFRNDPEKRDLEDFCHIGFLLEEPNPAENLKSLMEKLIRSGDCSIPIEYAINLYKMKQYKQAFNYFSLISKFNYPVAKFFVGVMKYRGEGCEKDIDDAYKILKNLSDIGFDTASKFIEENFNDLSS